MIPKIISYKTLKEKFTNVFSVPRMQEVWVEVGSNFWIIDFEKRGYCVTCKVTMKELIEELKIELDEAGRELTKESVDNAISKFDNEFIRYSINAKNFYNFFPEVIEE